VGKRFRKGSEELGRMEEVYIVEIEGKLELNKYKRRRE
jgi:hypothetical protein